METNTEEIFNNDLIIIKIHELLFYCKKIDEICSEGLKDNLGGIS